MLLFRLVASLSLTGCALSIVVTSSQKVVNVSIYDTAMLQCNFSTNEPTKQLTVAWTFYPKSSPTPEQVYYYQSGVEVIGQQFKDRLKVLYPPLSTTMNATISISDMRIVDAGTYMCEVHNLPDISGISTATVIVHVFEKPSYPFCAVHGDVATGHLVTLTCHSEKGNPPPKYTWSRIEQGTSNMVINADESGVLSFRNISQFQFGKYQCNASNTVGTSTCTVTLNSETHAATIVGAVIGALLAAVFVALLAWCISHHLKKKKYEAAKANAETAVDYKAVPPQEMKELQA
ncbi:V-set and immunoglobulin domain-containing protein 1-like [Brachyhypopomus gauderio]|uniref:V-set and immunoglobulin domain-containing protein 1-like n=1 Tax=Brachyhypopomus gauderio TaxID=698409 RepID=UPI00404392E7